MEFLFKAWHSRYTQQGFHDEFDFRVVNSLIVTALPDAPRWSRLAFTPPELQPDTVYVFSSCSNISYEAKRPMQQGV